jgi:hypothetical protein
MVQKGKRKQKKSTKRTPKKIVLQCGESIYKLPVKGPDSQIQKCLLIELDEELDHIYTAYLAELTNRVNSIPVLKASYKLQEFPYKIEANRIAILRSKVKKLMNSEQTKLIYNIFYITIHKFLGNIQQELNRFHGCSSGVIVMCLAEALNALECSAKELGKITENMPEHSEIEENCENITKVAFFEKVLRNYEEVLIKHSHLSDSIILHNMVTLLGELKKTKALKNFVDDNNSTALCEKSIEEIMEFIDGGRESGKMSKKEVQKMKGLDEEIENFKQVLEKSQAGGFKMKPNLTSEWIKGLKFRIERNKTNN